MSTPSSVAVHAAFIADSKRSERRFFGGMAVALALTVFLGFAPSYYLKAHFNAGPQLTGALHLHGLAFTLWMVLLVTQTSLIAAGRTALHRYLGMAGGVLAVSMTILGAVVAITRARQGVLGQGSAPPLVFLAIPFFTLVVFPTLIGAALYFRRRADVHKRLILLATIEIVIAAVARLPVISASPLAFFAVGDLFVLALVAYDLATRGRVHSATLWGGLFVIASQPARLLVSGSAGWLAFAQWLTG